MNNHWGFQVLTVVKIKIMVFWDVMLCSLVDRFLTTEIICSRK